MSSFISKFALTPFLYPSQPEPKPSSTQLRPQDTLLTFFEGFDRPILNDKNEKWQMLKNLEECLPLTCNLQSEKMPPGSESNRYSGSVSLFLNYLGVPTAHLFSLCPVPKFDALKVDDFLTFCIDARCVPQRLAWGLHQFMKKTGVSADILTNALKELNVNDKSYFVKVCRALYKENLIEHVPFMLWAVQYFEPSELGSFQKDFIMTHSLLSAALNTVNYEKFIEMFKTDLLINQSHLVQLAVICNFKENPYNQNILRLISNENTKKRVRYIFELLFPAKTMSHCSPPLSFYIPKVIFQTYPKYDFLKILNDIQQVLFCLKQSKINKIGISICQALFYHDENVTNTVNLSALIAWLLLNLKCKIYTSEFVHFIYEHEDKISSLKYLFCELQYQKIISFKEFQAEIHRKGYFSTKFELTCRIFSEFPSLDRSKETMRNAERDLKRAHPDINYAEQVKDANITKDNIFDKIEFIKSLPFVLQFEIMHFIISQLDFTDESNASKNDILNKLCELLEDLNCSFLIPDIIIKFDFRYRNSSKFYALYEAHKVKPDSNFENKNDDFDICKPKLINLFLEYSYLCSLFVFDSIFSAKSMMDLYSILIPMFKNILSFKFVPTAHVTDFAIDFYNSQIVTEPLNILLQTFIIICVSSNKGSDYFDRFSILISKILKEFFVRSYIKPCEYLMILFSMTNSLPDLQAKFKFNMEVSQNQILEAFIRIIFNIIDENQQLFTVNDCLTSEVVDGFNNFLPPDSQHLYYGYLTRLRSLEFPQLHTNPSLSFATALFSLLPTEMFSDDVESVINFFKQNLTYKNVRLWSLWIRDKPKFQSGFPVKIHESSELDRNRYITALVNIFTDVSTPLLRESWWIICENKAISNAVIFKIINESIYNFEYIQPPLLTADESIYERLCEKLRNQINVFGNYRSGNNEASNIVRIASMTFIIFIFRFATNQNLINNIALRLLEWIRDLSDNLNLDLINLIDTFNFIICWMPNDFQDNLHNRIFPTLKELPKYIQKKLLLNKPRQSFKTIPDPIFSDYASPTSDPASQFPLSSTYNESANDGSLLGWIGNLDDVDQLFWS